MIILSSDKKKFENKNMRIKATKTMTNIMILLQTEVNTG